MFNLKLKEIVGNSLYVHPNGSAFDFIFDGGAGYGSLSLAMLAGDNPFNLVIGDPASVADCVDQLALAIRRMDNIKCTVYVPFSESMW